MESKQLPVFPRYLQRKTPNCVHLVSIGSFILPADVRGKMLLHPLNNDVSLNSIRKNRFQSEAALLIPARLWWRVASVPADRL